MLIVFLCTVYLLVIVWLSCDFRLEMVSLIHFRVTPGKWLESVCSVVIFGSFMVCMMV